MRTHLGLIVAEICQSGSSRGAVVNKRSDLRRARIVALLKASNNPDRKLAKRVLKKPAGFAVVGQGVKA